MPQRAILDGQETVYAFETSAEVWDGLSAAYAADSLVLACCGSPAIPKCNAHGTKWFAHRPYARIACDWKATDARHEAVVAAISAMAKERGWEVETEARGEGWRADVLCRRPKANIRVAFQIELLRREEADILVDSAALQAASIAAWWIFPGRRKHSIPTLPRVGTVRTGDGANTVGEGAAFAARVLNGVERAFVVANSVIRALKSAGWDYETRFDMGIPACISATDPTDGHGVEIKVGSKVDLGFMVRGEASARRRNAEAQEQLVSLFRERLDRGIELWWPNYPRLDAETFRPLREAINTQRPAQFTRTTSPAPATQPIVAPAASVGAMEPWMEEAARQPPPEWRPNWARDVDAASEPRRPRYFDPVPGLMAAAERGETAEPAALSHPPRRRDRYVACGGRNLDEHSERRTRRADAARSSSGIVASPRGMRGGARNSRPVHAGKSPLICATSRRRLKIGSRQARPARPLSDWRVRPCPGDERDACLRRHHRR